MIEMLLGHIVGDYVLQNDAMAKGKSKPGTVGALYCLEHCVIYSLFVALFMALAGGWRARDCGLVESGAIAFGTAFFCHYTIDRRSLGKVWMRWYGQTTEGPFAPIVYIGVDNGLHLTLMYLWFLVLGAVQ